MQEAAVQVNKALSDADDCLFMKLAIIIGVKFAYDHISTPSSIEDVRLASAWLNIIFLKSLFELWKTESNFNPDEGGG